MKSFCRGGEKGTAMSLKKYVFGRTRSLVKSNQVIRRLSRKGLSREQYLLFAAQRGSIATNFNSLLDRGVELAKQIGDSKLEDALQSNLNDELGYNSEGRINPDLAHKKWKIDYLAALGIAADHPNFKPLKATKSHVDTFLALEEGGNVFNIAGALLYSENIIPVEYRAATNSRDYLFPEIFCITDRDSDVQVLNKEKARRYMDDHILHDAQSHFPDLLRALETYESDVDVFQDIKKGVDLVDCARKKFYHCLEQAFAMPNSALEFYVGRRYADPGKGARSSSPSDKSDR